MFEVSMITESDCIILMLSGHFDLQSRISFQAAMKEVNSANPVRLF